MVLSQGLKTNKWRERKPRHRYMYIYLSIYALCMMEVSLQICEKWLFNEYANLYGRKTESLSYMIHTKKAERVIF